MNNRDADLYALIHDLVADQLEEGARGLDQRELQELVTKDPHARRIYVQYMQETFHIASRLATVPSLSRHEQALATNKESIPNSKDRQRGWSASPKMLLSLAVAAMLFLVGLSWYAMTPITGDNRVARNNTESEVVAGARENQGATVATLVRSDEAIWNVSGNQLAESSRLAVGQELHLLRGSVELVFDTGVEALLLAPCQIKILGGNQISSEYGRISARVGESGKGFAIETPVARVIDQGTEFGIAISDTGQTEVAVFEGEVDLEFDFAADREGVRSHGKRDRLTQGEALKIDHWGVSSRIMSIDNIRLPTVRQLPPMYHRQPVIEAVRDNIGERGTESRKFYRIVHAGLREDCRAYVDRTHQWNGIDAGGLPKQLVGADYVMPFNDDKFVKDLSVEVKLTQPATLFIFLSDNVAVPEWLSREFVDTGLKIGLDEGPNKYNFEKETGVGPGKSIDTIFSIWKQEISTPGTIALGSVERPENTVGYNMYGIAAIGL